MTAVFDNLVRLVMSRGREFLKHDTIGEVEYEQRRKRDDFLKILSDQFRAETSDTENAVLS